MPTVTATDATFQKEVLESDVPVLVDFWAEWCMPCKAIAPHLEALAAQHGGKLKIVKVDIQTNMKTASALKITAIPLLLLYKNGAVVAKQQGASGLAQLQKLVAPHVG